MHPMATVASSGDVGTLTIVPLVALALMVGEYLLGRYRHQQTHDIGETVASLVIAIGHRITAAATAAVATVPATWIYRHRLFDIPLDEAWSLVALFVGTEFCYYWQHVAMHKVKWFWASHAVHHSATRLNLSAAIRLGWGSSFTGGFLFFLPLIWIGFSPVAVFVTVGVGLLYQFFLHLARAPRLGWLEWILNTPAHHHVHHAANATCLDRNFGSVLIVFDRLFGTFAGAPPDEPLRFGIKGTVGPTRGPMRVVLAGWLAMARELRAAADWRMRWTALFGRPGQVTAILLIAALAPGRASADDIDWKIQVDGREQSYTVQYCCDLLDGRSAVANGGQCDSRSTSATAVNIPSQW